MWNPFSSNRKLQQQIADQAAEIAELKSVAGRKLTNGPTGGTAVYSSQLNAPSEQYRHFQGWPFVAINRIATKAAGQDLFVARERRTPQRRGKAQGDRLEPLPTHALLDRIARPNPLMVRWSLLWATVANLELTGASFWWMPDADDGGPPEIWPLPSHWVSPTDSLRGGWKVRANGVEFNVPAEEIALFSLPDPSDPFGTISPLQTQAPAVATDESIQASQHRAFQNGINPGVILRAGKLPSQVSGLQGETPILSDDQRRELVEAIQAAYRGVANKGEPLILDGLIESVEKFTHTPEEMDFLDSGKTTKSRILQAYGVNPIIAGEIENANRASAAVAEQLFASGVINPLLELLSQGMTAWVCPRFAADGEKLTAWFAPMVARDPELNLRRWEIGLRSGAVGIGEYRTNVLNLPAEIPPGDAPIGLFGARQSVTDAHKSNGKANGRCILPSG